MEVVKHCQAPIARDASLFYSPTQGTGPFVTDQIGYDLDSQVAVGQFIPAIGTHLGSGGNYFTKRVVVLRAGEPQTFGIFVTTKQHYCRFTFRMHIATPSGNSVTEDISDHGRPFQLTFDGESGADPAHVPFSSYRAVYAGGAANEPRGGAFVLVNPATYKGYGDPETYPVRAA